MAHHEQESLSAPMTVVGMVNGMIGGLILLLPVYALNAGYILTLIVIGFTGIFSFYSCYLCVAHMGDQPDLDYSIFRHFNGQRWVKVFYDLCVWSNLILIDMLYFQLIVLQWQGLIPPHQFSFINPVVNAFILIAFVFVLKYFQFGASIMAYGIISIISYLIFLVWVIATYNQGNYSVDYKPFGTGAVNLAAAMGAAFSIQSFFIPVLKKSPDPKKYTFYTLLAYIIGGAAYYYIAYVGSVGIWHRPYYSEKGQQQTIEGYFPQGAWQVNIIEAIYLVHLYSVFPEFMLVSKKRMFGVLGLKESEKSKVNLSQLFYFIIMVGICFLVGFFRIDIDDIININGAVIGFFFIYLIPAVLHIKCLYFSKGKQPLLELSVITSSQNKDTENASTQRKRVASQIQFVTTNINQQKNSIAQPLLNPSHVERDQPNQDQRKETFNSLPRRPEAVTSIVPLQQYDYTTFRCDCNLQTYSRGALVLDWIAIVVMVGLGIFIMINGIYTVATS